MGVDTENLKLNVVNRFNHYLHSLEASHIEQIQEITINSSEFRTTDKISRALEKISNPVFPVIYKMEIVSSADKEGLIRAYREFHEMNKTLDRGLDRLNVSRFNDTNSSTLYIGSKMKNLRARIRQHLGGGNFRTFGLHLNKWDGSLSYELKLEILRVNLDVDSKYQRTLTEFFEQELWEECQPIFGKRSGL